MSDSNAPESTGRDSKTERLKAERLDTGQPHAAQESATVLIVEADDATRELYRRELARAYQVLACDGEREARSALEGRRVRAIVLEPNGAAALSDDSGWRFLRILRQDLRYRDVPVILCSTVDERKRGAHFGVAACLIKPVLPTKLLATVEAVLQT